MTVPRTISKKVAIMAGGGVLVLAVAAWGVSSHYLAAPAKSAAVDPEKLWEDMQKPGITEKERDEIRHKMFEAREAELDTRVQEYYRVPESQREALLDKQIDEFEKQRQEWEKRRQQEEERRAQSGQQNDGPTSRPFRDWRDNSTPEERKTRSETRSADKMAQRMAYFQAVRERMAARGIQMPWGPGPGRGGPGRGGPGGPGGGHRGGGPH
ncbi:MAG TPA: hypothetical protein VMV94_04485 [Phycisphaerae bacterium]|nr:hypothetical protein [Phycisphaerae bacterium]